MPPRSFHGGGGGHSSDIDEFPLPSTSATWNPTTIAVDFASHHGARSGSTIVGPTAANRSDRDLAPSVASYINVTPPFDLYQGQQQQQQWILPTSAHTPAHTGTDQPYPGSGWSGFPHSIPTPPGPSPHTPLSQSALRDEAAGSSSGNTMESATAVPHASRLTARAHHINRRKATTGSAMNPAEKTQAILSTGTSAENLSSKSRPGSSSGKKQCKPTPKPEMARPGSSHREEDSQKETALPNPKDGSISSSTHSNQSGTSFDFSRVDRLGDSSYAPGVLRLGQRSSSLHSQRTLPDEKGFSIQIGSELFKLSGASIMSDGRFDSEHHRP
ncbi:MAG: hypothetical protein Q9225_003172 [Loekoesia sp. 1 TL-2023]